MTVINRTNQVNEKLRLSGLDCADCAVTIERSLAGVPGVASAEVRFAASSAEVSYDPSQVTRADLERRISALGYSVEQAPAGRATGSLEFAIEGMDCGDCAVTVEKAVAGIGGVQSASVNLGTGRLTVVAPGEEMDVARQVERMVSLAGYRAVPAKQRQPVAHTAFWRERRVITTGLSLAAALFAFALSFTTAPLWAVNAAYAVAIVVGGYVFARAGLIALRAGRADMNLLMSVAAVGAALLGDWPEAATVVLLFSIGGALQALTLERTRGAIRSLMDLTPTMALVRRPSLEAGSAIGTMREFRVPVEEVSPGEVVAVGPGERLPLDGVVIDGASSIDRSPITGESVPVDVEAGGEVFAGTINGPGAFRMRTTRQANNTTLARIIDMVEDAQARRAPSQQFVDRFSAIYTPMVIAAAAFIALVPPLVTQEAFSVWFYRALVLLVVACPCALVISTPVSIVAAIGAATRRGVLIKGGSTLETLAGVRAVAFDKTGTLTQGRPVVASVYAAVGDTESVLLAAARVEARSEHPLARAIVHAARDLVRGDLPEAEGYRTLPGRGATAQVDERPMFVGNKRLFGELGVSLDTLSGELERLESAGSTVVIVGTGASALGLIALADAPRVDAARTIALLKAAGVGTVSMLTGDNPRTAEAIARQIGVSEVRAELLPQEKAEAIRDLSGRSGPVAMVGDGVNDAPALATAAVGIAMGAAGTDAALEVADVALMSDDLPKIVYAVELSRATLIIIKTNIVLSIAVKAAALALAVFGALPLWGAILADMGVSLLVTLNGMRLLAFKGRSEAG